MFWDEDVAPVVKRYAMMAGLGAEWVARQRGWRSFALAACAGAVTVLALAPFHFWLVPFLTLPFLMWLLDGAARGDVKSRFLAGARIGWAFGFGYFGAGLYWIGSAFLVEADKFAWALPFAVSLMPAGLALFYAAAAGFAASVWRAGVSRSLALALGLGAAEWVRGHVLTGFPWNAIGYTLAGEDVLLQSTSLIGIYGLGLFAVLLYTLPALYIAPRRALAGERGGIGVAHTAGLGLLTVAAVLYGAARLAEDGVKDVPGVRLRIVQPNIAQTDKWRPEKKQWIFSRYLDLSQRDSAMQKSGLQGVTHLIWPESALPFLLADSEAAKSALSEIFPEGLVFMTGALRLERGAARKAEGSEHKVYNSLFVTDRTVKLLSVYDKMHLVPFGEYLPFQKTLEWIGLEQLTRIRGGFESGAGPRFLRAPGVPPFSPLICYEIIFPGAVADRDSRPGWLLNVTNDAWFGRSSGPYQHLHQARVRAVEEGLAVVRAANTGVSAIIDPYGRVVQHVALNHAGIIDSGLPIALAPTLFVQMGEVLIAGVYILFLIYLLILRRGDVFSS